MKINAITEYALRCLILLANQSAGKSLSITEISAREHLSKHYAEQILLKLRRAGFVQSLRGIHGGYLLSRKPSEISVGEVIRTLEGAPFDKTCDSFNRIGDGCGHLGGCTLRPLWSLLAQHLWTVLDKTTIQHLIGTEPQVAKDLYMTLPVLNSAYPESVQ